MRLQLGLIATVVFGFGHAIAWGQAAASKAETAAKPAAGVPGKPFVDLTNRYRFVEHYTNKPEAVAPGIIGQYSVAMREVFRESNDASKPTEVSRSTIYAERPSDVNSLGVVATTVRRYQRFQVVSEEKAEGAVATPFDGLTIWYHPQTMSNEAPLILSLTRDRKLTDHEYEIATHQLFMPGLTAVLPSQAIRIGDSWRVPRKGVTSLVGDISVKGYNLVGKFTELRRSDDGKTSYAVLAYSGGAMNELGEMTVTAQALFTFATPPPPGPNESSNPLAKRAESTIDAKGAITEVRMARVTSGPFPGAAAGKPQRFRSEQELVLARRLGEDPNTGAVRLPEAPPVTDANSWLVYNDPKGRFYFQHPQDLLIPERFQLATKPGDESILLVKARPEGRDFVRLTAFGKDPTPEALKNALTAQWKQLQAEVVPGTEEWLPNAEWPGMQVYRIEAALKLPGRGGRSGRMHYDAYLVKLPNNVALMVVATTTRDGLAAFRKDVEGMIRTFRLGKPPG